MEYAGCWFAPIATQWWQKQYLPLLKSSFHTTILADMQQTTLKQTFTNSTKQHIEKCKYSFPIYDGVSVTAFTCEIADRKLIGVVKEKAQAKAEFDAAVMQGKKAGLLEQSSTADVFSTSLGNVEQGQDVHVTITYIGELKNDFDNDGIRLTIPTRIAPRYGDLPSGLRDSNTVSSKGIEITVDVIMPKDKPISGLESPSHPVSISLGKMSTDTADQEPSFSRASATLSQQSDGLDKDFVILVKAKDTGEPTAILQTHPTLKNHRVLMTSLVPKFTLPSIRPEIVFVADRSGSMNGNIAMLQQAMKVFLKSLPAGVKFNICSFGSHHTFLWPKSQNYTQETLKKANKHVETFAADYGGTETLGALEATIKNRYKDIPLEIILLTDGDIWAQDQAFSSIKKAVAESKDQIRLFPLGIGNGVSHSLIEGLARAGNGFAQAVQLNERIDTRVVRMLKGALTPHIQDYKLEIKYETDDDFELIEAVQETLKLDSPAETKSRKPSVVKTVISLFNKDVDPDKMDTDEDKSSPLPELTAPKLLQAPYAIPSLYSFSRTTVYVIMSPETIQRNPKSVILKADSEHGPLRLEIPVTILDTPGEAISQLAARKAVQDFEESRGWVYQATNSVGKKLMDLYPSRSEDMLKQEAVRLGTTYQIANKWCSFIAVEADSPEAKRTDFEEAPPAYPDLPGESFDGATRRRLGGPRNFSARASHAPPPPPSATLSAFAYGAPPPAPSAARPGMFKYNATFDIKPDMRYKAAPKILASRAARFPPPVASDSDEDDEDEAEDEDEESSPSADQSNVMRALSEASPGSPASYMECDRKESSLLSYDPTIESQPSSKKFRKVSGSFGGSGAGSLAQANSASRGGSRFSAALAGVFKSKNVSTDKEYEIQCDEASQEEEKTVLSDSEKVHHLISLQDFDGFWQLSSDIKNITSLDDAQLKAHSGNTWITILIVTFLQKKMAAEKEVWELVVDKAMDWLQQQNADQKLFSEAEALFKV